MISSDIYSDACLTSPPALDASPRFTHKVSNHDSSCPDKKASVLTILTVWIPDPSCFRAHFQQYNDLTATTHSFHAVIVGEVFPREKRRYENSFFRLY